MDFGSIVNTMDTGIFAVNDVYIVILYEHLLSSDIFLRIMKKDQKCSKFEPHRDVWVNTEGTGRVLLDLENTQPQEIFLNDGNSNQLIYVDNHTLYLISLNVGTFTRKFDIAGRKIPEIHALISGYHFLFSEVHILFHVYRYST